MNVTIIGLGLIGGSFSLALQKARPDVHVIGVDQNEQNCSDATALGLVHEIKPLSEAALADMVVIAIPVNAAKKVLVEVLNLVKPGAVVIDMGSTKAGICEMVSQHPKRNQYVAFHPIAGTENTGPSAAFDSLFNGKIGIVCEQERSSEQALGLIVPIIEEVGMRIKYMGADEHDKHMAYVSHLSHISSFMLGLTVLDIEEDEANIFDLAGSGFESTVRLAKSSPDMWAPIYEQNSDHLTVALDSYIKHLTNFKHQIEQNNTENTKKLMQKANDVRRILDGEPQKR